MSTPAVGVVIPTYQRLSYLGRALESVLDQTYRDFEVVVSDNSAATQVRDLVESYREPRLRNGHNGHNIAVDGGPV